MSGQLKFKTLVFALILLFPILGFSQKRSAVIPGSGHQNEVQAIESLKDIYKAEAAYFWASFGFESLPELQRNRLIDKALGAGEKYGYKFTLFHTRASIHEPARFRLWATPKIYGRTGTRSFYMTNTCVISGADRGGADADQNDPVIDQCTPTIAYDLGRFSLMGIRNVAAAEFTYNATTGNGAYGTQQQLADAQLLIAPLGPANNWWGHHSWVVSPSASSFKAWATPMFYRETGMLSYYTDESGIVRGADRGGAMAKRSDPQIDPFEPGNTVTNERFALYLLGGFWAAQRSFSNYGANDYGTFGQLDVNNLYRMPLQVDRFQGYVYTLTLAPRNGNTPPHFEVSLVPEQYGVTGTKSFYMDESRTVHGADRGGAPATREDPAVVFIP